MRAVAYRWAIHTLLRDSCCCCCCRIAHSELLVVLPCRPFHSLLLRAHDDAAAATSYRAGSKPKKIPAALRHGVAGLVLASAGLFIAALWAGKGDLFPSGENKPCSDGPSCSPVLRVFIAWVGLYFCFLFSQSYRVFNSVSKGKGDIGSVKYGNAGGRSILTGNRTVANMVEQSFPFLASLGLHALLVNVASAAQLGWYWLFFRAIYPFVFAMGPPMLFVSTIPGYALLGMLAWPVGKIAFA